MKKGGCGNISAAALRIFKNYLVSHYGLRPDAAAAAVLAIIRQWNENNRVYGYRTAKIGWSCSGPHSIA